LTDREVAGLTKVLIVYDSRTGNTEKMADAVAEGVRQVDGASPIVMNVDKAKLDDLLGADAIVLGSPTYYGNMSGRMKELLDTTFNIHGKLKGKVGGAFTSSGGIACGAETTLLAMLQAMLVHGMIVQGRPDDKHYGATALEAPDEEAVGYCRELGNRVASLAVALKK
jgi:NAD(P)H dehydrogenase (quinone)